MTKEAHIEKLLAHRIELSDALREILGSAKPSLGTFVHTVPSYAIKAADKAYRKIWRKP